MGGVVGEGGWIGESVSRWVGGREPVYYSWLLAAWRCLPVLATNERTSERTNKRPTCREDLAVAKGREFGYIRGEDTGIAQLTTKDVVVPVRGDASHRPYIHRHHPNRLPRSERLVHARHAAGKEVNNEDDDAREHWRILARLLARHEVGRRIQHLAIQRA